MGIVPTCCRWVAYNNPGLRAVTGYAKLFSSIITSTIWRENPVVCKVWVTMLALTDRDGIVEGSIPGLAHLAGVSINETTEAIEKFTAPDDPYSRSPEFEGRRVEPVDGGWRILNHAKYRLRMSPEDIRERDRRRKQLYRERLKADCPTESGTKRDRAEMSDDSNKHTQKVDPKTNENTHTETAPDRACEAYPYQGKTQSQIAADVCGQLHLSGARYRAGIEEVLSDEVSNSGDSPERVAARMVEAWQSHCVTPKAKGEMSYANPLGFLRSNLWRSKQPEPARREKSLTERMRERGMLPPESDEELEKRLIAEGRERRRKAAEAKAG